MMPISRYVRPKYLVPVVGVAVILGMVTAASLGTLALVDLGVRLDAGRKAQQWTDRVATEIPRLDALLAGTPADLGQRSIIAELSRSGDIFDFVLFGKTGAFALESNATYPAAGDIRRVLDKGAVPAALGGAPQLSMHFSGGDQGVPATYAEVYLPIRNGIGQVIGVAATYVDQSSIAKVFREGTLALSLTLSAVFGIALMTICFGFMQKNSQAKLARRTAKYLRQYDPVSGLRNREAFTEAAGRVLAGERGKTSRTSFLYVDVDHLRAVNELHGQKGGNALLRHIGDVIGSRLRKGDLGGRLGGDEFAILVQSVGPKEVEALAARLLAMIASAVSSGGSTFSGTVCIGIELSDGTPRSLEDRGHRALLALYQAKIDGPNAYRVFTRELELEVAGRKRLESAVIEGLEANLFSARFQPIIQQSTLHCVGFEALLRLQLLDGTSVPPIEFIPVAEQSGAIVELGTWILHRAVEAAASWPETLFVAVNLSARQFENGKLPETVKNVLETYNFAPHRLELEVTESLLMNDAESVSRQLDALKRLGISLAMDDFGTGFSSLGYLWKFGFDKLKIDRSFITGLGADEPRARKIIDSIVTLAHRLDMVVTAEGLETQGQVDILRGLNCDQFQGYLFGTAMPLVDLPAFILRQNRVNSLVPEPPARFAS